VPSIRCESWALGTDVRPTCSGFRDNSVSFKRKLLGAFCVMTIPLGLVVAQALWNVREQKAAVNRLELSLSRAQIFADLESMTYRKVRRIRDYLSGLNPEAKVEFQYFDLACQSKLAEWKGANPDPADLRLSQDFERLDREVDVLARQLFSMFEEGKKEQAQRLVQTDLNARLLPALDRVITDIYANTRTRSVQQAFSELEATAGSTTLIFILVVVTSAVLSVAIPIVVARNLARPVERLKEIMDEVGEGRFDRARTADPQSRDEIGELARAFVRMAERLGRAQEDLRGKIDSLRRTQAQLIQSEKLASLGQMSAAIAHGLRNPLASIRAAAQLSLHRLPPASPVQEQLRAVIDEVDRLENRIVHLLDFTKPVGFSPEATPLKQIVERVVGVFGEKISKQGVGVHLDLDPASPEAWVDPSQVEQAILEIMSNALEAMPKGGELAITVRPAPEANGSTLEVTISDTGEGIGPDALPRVGEPFFTTKADGTGLGLAIAKRFVEQNKGQFRISSLERKGTLVSLRLPAVQAGGESTA
jgi:signal transduction histidine kinase